ncbi:hypothetical protein V1478_016234 [Vespula squamosa]|uniref:Uncharacterized protein n=1 Tax=Vespula squamosa TaxID=30214 RepID=A0ABD1ZZU7_VESSQ
MGEAFGICRENEEMVIRRDGHIHSRHKLRIEQSRIIKVNAMVTTRTYVCSPPRLECKSSNVRVSAGTQAASKQADSNYTNEEIVPFLFLFVFVHVVREIQVMVTGNGNGGGGSGSDGNGGDDGKGEEGGRERHTYLQT